MQKKLIDGVKKFTDASGNISKADYVKAQRESNKTAIENLKQQFTAMLSALPPAAQGPAMMVSGFLDPVALIEKIMTAEPFYGLPFVDEVFANFGTGDKMNVGSTQSVMAMAMGFLAGDSASTAEDRAKAVFGLLDTNSDGHISPKEAARIVGGIVRCAGKLVAVVLDFYLEFLGHSDFITGLLSAAEGMAPMGPAEFKDAKFPLQKSFIEGIIKRKLHLGVDGEKKLKQLFAFCDVDKDGFLTLEEFNRIEAGRLSKRNFDAACHMKGTECVECGANFEIFASMYDNGYDLNADYARIMAIILDRDGSVQLC